jgi:hypothetical protein
MLKGLNIQMQVMHKETNLNCKAYRAHQYPTTQSNGLGISNEKIFACDLYLEF